MTDRVAIVDESRSVRTPDLPGATGQATMRDQRRGFRWAGMDRPTRGVIDRAPEIPRAPNRVRLKILLYWRPAPRLTGRDRRRNGRRRWALPRSW
jgi:hypothetical protein